MQYTLSEVRRLFVVLIEATGAVPSTLGTRISQNPKLIPRLLDGDGCASMTGERASDYIDANWPEHLPWPEDVPRRDHQAPQPTRLEALGLGARLSRSWAAAILARARDRKRAAGGASS